MKNEFSKIENFNLQKKFSNLIRHYENCNVNHPCGDCEDFEEIKEILTREK